MASVRFPKPEVVLSQPWIETSHQNLAGELISTFWADPVTIPKPASTFRTLWPPSWKIDMTPQPIVRLLRNLVGRC